MSNFTQYIEQIDSLIETTISRDIPDPFLSENAGAVAGCREHHANAPRRQAGNSAFDIRLIANIADNISGKMRRFRVAMGGSLSDQGAFHSVSGSPNNRSQIVMKRTSVSRRRTVSRRFLLTTRQRAGQYFSMKPFSARGGAGLVSSLYFTSIGTTLLPVSTTKSISVFDFVRQNRMR